jgi:hypothetical protein
MIISDNGFMGDPSELVIKKIAEREREKIARLEAALKEIQDHCAGKTGSLQAVVVVIVRKALEGR